MGSEKVIAGIQERIAYNQNVIKEYEEVLSMVEQMIKAIPPMATRIVGTQRIVRRYREELSSLMETYKHDVARLKQEIEEYKQMLNQSGQRTQY